MPWTDISLTTDRLLLRPFVDDDKPAIIALRTSDEVRAYLGGALGEEAADEIRSATVGEQWGVFGVVERASGETIGAVVLGRERGELELSYEFLPGHWARGLGGEAVGAVIGWAAAHLDDDSIIAVTQTANARSVAMLERLGFEHERTFEEFDAEQRQYRRTLQRDPMGG